MFFFFNDTATTEIYTLSLHDALPISERFLYTLMRKLEEMRIPEDLYQYPKVGKEFDDRPPTWKEFTAVLRKTRNKDRKSTRLNSSHW